MRMISADTVHESIQWEWKRNWCKSQKTFPSTRVSSYSYQSARWEKYEHLGRVRNYEPLYAHKSAFQWACPRVLKSHITQCLCSVSLPQHVCTGPWEWLVPHSCHYSQFKTLKGGNVAKVTLSAGWAILYCVVRCQDRLNFQSHLDLGDLDVCRNRHFLSVCLPQLHSPDSHRLLSSCPPPLRPALTHKLANESANPLRPTANVFAWSPNAHKHILLHGTRPRWGFWGRASEAQGWKLHANRCWGPCHKLPPLPNWNEIV